MNAMWWLMAAGTAVFFAACIIDLRRDTKEMRRRAEGRMNPKVKDMWVRAMRSGDYRPGSPGKFRDTADGFCPLGVLYDLYIKNTRRARWMAVADSGYAPVVGRHNMQYGANLEMHRWSGLDVVPSGDVVHVMSMHDAGRKPFNEVADYIEMVF